MRRQPKSTSAVDNVTLGRNLLPTENEKTVEVTESRDSCLSHFAYTPSASQAATWQRFVLMCGCVGHPRRSQASLGSFRPPQRTLALPFRQEESSLTFRVFGRFFSLILVNVLGLGLSSVSGSTRTVVRSTSFNDSFFEDDS